MRNTAILTTTLMVLFALPGFSASSDWQNLRESAASLKTADPIYALFKLQKAWKLLSAESISKARTELLPEIAAVYDCLSPGTGEKCKKLSDEKLNEYMTSSEPASEWADWQVSMMKDRSLCLTIYQGAYQNAAEGCGNGLAYIGAMKDDDPRKLQYLAGVKEKTESLKKLRASLPVVYSPKDAKYDDLLSLASPLEPGNSRLIKFDLNPFVPQGFTRILYPY
jgi:hypothetical protein